MKAAILKQTVKDLVEAHHDAFVVELLGAEGSGLSVERVQELVELGMVDPKKLAGWMIPGMSNRIDPFLFTRLMSKVVDDTPPERQHELRDWTLDQWKAEVDTIFPQYMTQRGPETGSVVFGLPDRPEVPRNLPPHGIPTRDKAPAWMSPAEEQSYIMARTHAGAYAKRLGQELADDMGQTVLEEWHEEEIVTEADAELRQERLAQIRDATGEALATHGDAERLAVDLMRRTDDWEHNWERIARTELQAAYNDGRVLDAMEAYGQDTQIARITEFNACKQCKALFNGPDGPIVWPLAEILSNGTNVGKRRSDWSASIYPLHPNCKCDTLVVPPGLVVDRDGRLQKPNAGAGE
jgi:hypothetical protein